MLNRLLDTFHQIGGVIGASVLQDDGTKVASSSGTSVEGEVVTELLHEARRCCSSLSAGLVEQVWLENEKESLLVQSLDGGMSLWVTASSETPIGRMRHQAATLAPVINDLI